MTSSTVTGDLVHVVEVGLASGVPGGAASATVDLHGTVATVARPTLLVAHGNQPGIVVGPSLRNQHVGHLVNTVIDVGLRSVVRPRAPFVWGRATLFGGELRRAMASADVVQVYWNDRMLGVSGLTDLVAGGKPVVLVPMDFEPLTGGCHYPLDGCVGYHGDCSACPIAASPILRRTAMKRRAAKRAILAAPNVFVVAGNAWYRDRVVEAGCAPERVRVVYTPVDHCYHEAERAGWLSSRLGPAVRGPVLMLGATRVDDARKRVGEGLAIATGVMRRDPTVSLVIAGQGELDVEADVAARVHRLGALSQPDLACALAESDVFVSASIDDGGPMMVAAAWSAGTPVASHRIGYAADLLQGGLDGVFLTPDELDANVDRLTSLLASVMSDRAGAATLCRAHGQSFTRLAAARGYDGLYRHMIGQLSSVG